MFNKEILLFIPTLNEEKYINIILEKLEVYSEKLDLLLIDDNSSDNTVKCFNDHKGKLNKSIIVRKNKSGVGSAHLDAIKYAKKKSYKYILTMDCDLTHNPKDILIFLKFYKQYDFLVASRFILKESLVEWELWRKILTYTAHYICMIFLNIKFDTTSGFRMYKLECIENDFFNFIDKKDYSFFIQSGFYINRRKMKIKEIAVKLPIRKYGNSKMRMRHVITTVQLILKLLLIKSIN